MESIGKLIGTVFDILKKLWENVLVPFLSFLANNVFPVIAPIIERIGTFFLTNIQMIISKFKLIVDVITGVLKILEGIFSGDWAKIWEGVKDIFVGVWDFIVRCYFNSLGTN